MTLTCQEASQSGSVASAPPGRAIPALAQNRSMPSSMSAAPLIRLATPSSLAASPGSASPPQDVGHLRAAAASMSFTTTRAPSAANRRASAAPMPLPAPVITTPAPATDFTAASLARFAAVSARPEPTGHSPGPDGRAR